jgi:UbiD family decarboxylase
MQFRQFLEQLEAEGELIRIAEPVALEFVAGALCRQLSDADGPAALLERVDGFAAPLAVNLYGPRRRIARALGVPADRLLEHVAGRLRERIQPVSIGSQAAPCQDVVLANGEADLTSWPFPFWNSGDGGRYITAGLTISRHPEFGWNIAHHRAQIYGPGEAGVCMAPDHHLRLTTDEARIEQRRVDAAIVVGVRPSITIAASSDFPLGDYELAVAGALEGKPIETVRCRTVDVEVPADSEMVIEGYYDGEVRSEGPFVEFTGYQTQTITSPVFKVTAITHRRDPIVHGIFAGKPPCETNTLWRELEESEAFDTLRRRFPLLKAVHRPPGIGRDFLGVLQIDRTRLRPGIVRTLMLATAAVMPRLKFVIAIDDDIDLYDINDVMWAVCTRCDPKRDLASIAETMTSWLDPSSRGLTGKVFLDATRKGDFAGTIPGYPAEAMQRARTLIASALAGARSTRTR